MESLKKVISLSQAAQISGYTQDYLGFLLRKGEIRGMKKGRVWFTTEEEIKNYLFKKKVRNEEFAIVDFFSPGRIKKIAIATAVILAGVFLLLSNLSRTDSELNSDSSGEIKSAISSNGENVSVPN